MVWLIQPKEIIDHDGKPSGRWRLVVQNDGNVWPMCSCENGHSNSDDAIDCVEARKNSEQYG
jgi:hypothetical protein